MSYPNWWKRLLLQLLFLQILSFLANKGPNTPDSMSVTNVTDFLIQVHLCLSVFKSWASRGLLYCLVTIFSSKMHSFSVWWWWEKYGQLEFVHHSFQFYHTYNCLILVSYYSRCIINTKWDGQDLYYLKELSAKYSIYKETYRFVTEKKKSTKSLAPTKNLP